MTRCILALDQGTTSSRAILFDHQGRPLSMAQQEFEQILPAPGHVEHDPEAIWSTQRDVARQVVKQSCVSAAEIAAIGIANQRETTILWDRRTGRAVAPAIVWQSRASAPVCELLRREGCEPLIRRKTGLVLDAYFSASKIRLLLDRHAGLRERAEKGDVLFGTVDSWLMWKLTGGSVHATDVSNASRTMLFDIDALDWDDELLELFRVPRPILPDVRDSSHVYGVTSRELFGEEIPIAGVAGDQQAAAFGQACFDAGMAKNTYGTGCFLMLRTAGRPPGDDGQILRTVGWRIAGRVAYFLEGAVFVAGAAVGWLRDGLGIIRASSEVEPLARSVPDAGGVVFVPAFVGLGAPYWDPYARGLLMGLTRGTTAAHVARAALDAMGYQTRDLIEAMQTEAELPVHALRVDGGASQNDLMLQFQADLLGIPVERPVVAETTALGAAYLAGLAVGFWQSEKELAQHWSLDRQFTPQLDKNDRDRLYRRWQDAVRRAQKWETP
jgi:glycerol kinase